jgi:phage terminase small subunit
MDMLKVKFADTVFVYPKAKTTYRLSAAQLLHIKLLKNADIPPLDLPCNRLMTYAHIY